MAALVWSRKTSAWMAALKRASMSGQRRAGGPPVLEQRLRDDEAHGGVVHGIAGARQRLIGLHLSGELRAVGRAPRGADGGVEPALLDAEGARGGVREPVEDGEEDGRVRLPRGDGEGHGAVAIELLGVQVEVALEAEADGVGGGQLRRRTARPTPCPSG